MAYFAFFQIFCANPLARTIRLGNERTERVTYKQDHVGASLLQFNFLAPPYDMLIFQHV